MFELLILLSSISYLEYDMPCMNKAALLCLDDFNFTPAASHLLLDKTIQDEHLFTITFARLKNTPCEPSIMFPVTCVSYHRRTVADSHSELPEPRRESFPCHWRPRRHHWSAAPAGWPASSAWGRLPVEAVQAGTAEGQSAPPTTAASAGSSGRKDEQVECDLLWVELSKNKTAKRTDLAGPLAQLPVSPSGGSRLKQEPERGTQSDPDTQPERKRWISSACSGKSPQPACWNVWTVRRHENCWCERHVSNNLITIHFHFAVFHLLKVPLQEIFLTSFNFLQSAGGVLRLLADTAAVEQHLFMLIQLLK